MLDFLRYVEKVMARVDSNSRMYDTNMKSQFKLIQNTVTFGKKKLKHNEYIMGD